MDKKIFIKYLEDSVLLYNKKLNNKEILILAKESNNVKNFKVTFSSSNFVHLTGVKTAMKADDFFKAVINKQINVNSLECKYNDMLMNRKKDAFPILCDIYNLAKNIGDYNNSGFKLKTDKILGNTMISVGLVYSDNKKYLIPNSLMQADSRTLTQKPFMPIIAMFIKNIKDKQFDTITYKSKNINIEKLHFPKEICEMLTENALYQLKPSLREAEQSRKEAAAAKEEAENISKEISTAQENTAFEKTQKAEAKRYNVEIIENIEFDSEIEFKDGEAIFHNYKAAAEKAKHQAVENSKISEIKKAAPKYQEKESIDSRLSRVKSVTQSMSVQKKESQNKQVHKRDDMSR